MLSRSRLGFAALPALFAFGVAASVSADPAHEAAAPSAISRALAEYFNDDEPGGAVIVTRDGKPLFCGGFGLASMELDVAVQPEMVFRLGSLTKPFTAMAIMILAERGKLCLHDDLEPGRIVDLFKRHPLAFEPGAGFAYSNSGFILIGEIIEKASGCSYAEFMKAEIFDPLGMKHTVVEDPSRVVRGCVSGYDFVDGRFVRCGFLNMTHVSAAGGLMSSVGDLAIWNAALDASRLVSARAVRSRQDASGSASPRCTSASFGPALATSSPLS
jgi:D-alanyl-D-alanine carboxypeptidase